jgi:hypothetical protein
LTDPLSFLADQFTAVDEPRTVGQRVFGI